jgi:hypothetical protein
MAVELAVALAAIATKAIVTQLVQGAPPSQGAWADVAGQVAETLVNSAARQESGIQRLESGIQRLGQQIDQVSQQVNEIPIREFGQHMAAGSRYVQDLRPAWRKKQDRRDLIHDARQEFVTAGSIAKQSNDLRRQALAEVAIAGCWLWVPSIDDVRNAAGLARQLLEREILYGTYSPPPRWASVRGLPWTGADTPVGDYIDVVRFCKAYGERSAYAAVPLGSSPEARLAVRAALDSWVECADVWVHITREQQPASATSPAATAKPAATLTNQGLARFLAQQQPAGNARLPGAYLRGQRGFGTGPAAVPPSQPPVALKVTVSNKRTTQVNVFLSETAARVAIGKPRVKLLGGYRQDQQDLASIAGGQSWSSVAPGETKFWRITVPSAADPGLGGPGHLTVQQRPGEGPAFQGSRGLLGLDAFQRNRGQPGLDAFQGNRGQPGGGLPDAGVVAFLYPAQP